MAKLEDQLAKLTAPSEPAPAVVPTPSSLLHTIPDSAREAVERTAERARQDSDCQAYDQELIRRKENAFPYRKLTKREKGKLLAENRINRIKYEVDSYECDLEKVSLLALEAVGLLTGDLSAYHELSERIKQVQSTRKILPTVDGLF